ncbi:MAG: HAD family hydrolase, partial [Acidimicrobiales bacterium]
LEGSWQAHVAAWRNGELFGPEGAARWCLARLGIEVDEALAAELARAIAEATHEAGIRIVEGAPEALEAVRRRHIPTALVCDTGFTPGSVVREALQELGLRLDHYVFSDEVGVPKPNPLIFRSALQATGADPERAVHIGDLRRTDVAGARAAGMATIRFAGVHDDSWADEEARGEEADAVLRRWADLLELLGF